MHPLRENESKREQALRAFPEGAIADDLDIKRCGLQTVVREESRKVR